MKKKDDNIDDCSKIFVSWSWLAGIAAVGVIGTCSIVLAYSDRENKQENRIERVEIDIKTISSLHRDIDTVKALLRQR
jgi:hypothetical protein